MKHLLVAVDVIHIKKKSGAVPGSQGLVVCSHILHTFWR